MPQFLLFGGALNNTFFGLQIYFWVILAMFLITCISYAVWYFFFWMPLKPLHGHFKAHTGGINSAFVFDEHLNFDLRSEKRAKLIFDMTVKEAKERQRDWYTAPSGLIGRVLTDLIFDGGRWARMDSSEREEIERVAQLWNESNPDDEVLTLIKFHKYLTEGRFEKMGIPVNLKPTYTVSWLRIDKAIPQGRKQSSWDGYLRQLAKKINEGETTDYNMYAYIILGMTAMICAGMLLLKFLK